MPPHMGITLIGDCLIVGLEQHNVPRCQPTHFAESRGHTSPFGSSECDAYTISIELWDKEIAKRLAAKILAARSAFSTLLHAQRHLDHEISKPVISRIPSGSSLAIKGNIDVASPILTSMALCHGPSLDPTSKIASVYLLPLESCISRPLHLFGTPNHCHHDDLNREALK